MNPASHTPAQAAILRRNNVVVQGHDQGRPALVFVNGFGSDQSTWRMVAPNFAGEHRVVLFDHVGIGRSELSASNAIRYASLQGYADDLLEVCDAAGAHNAVLVGHSVGAIIGMLAAIRWPSAFTTWCWSRLRPATSTTAATWAASNARTLTPCWRRWRPTTGTGPTRWRR